MRLLLERYGFGKDSTLGRLAVLHDGMEPEHLAFTIEDERRKVKVPGETCIPVGVYEVKLRNEGGMTQKYAAKFPSLHRGMLWLQNVPGFEWVYIHVGNTDDHTEGCILPNRKGVHTSDGEFKGEDSATVYVEVYKRVLAALDAGEVVTLTVAERVSE